MGRFRRKRHAKQTTYNTIYSRNNCNKGSILTILNLSFLCNPDNNDIRRYKFLKLIMSSSVIEDSDNEPTKGNKSTVANPSASKPYINLQIDYDQEPYMIATCDWDN